MLVADSTLRLASLLHLLAFASDSIDGSLTHRMPRALLAVAVRCKRLLFANAHLIQLGWAAAQSLALSSAASCMLHSNLACATCPLTQRRAVCIIGGGVYMYIRRNAKRKKAAKQ